MDQVGRVGGAARVSSSRPRSAGAEFRMPETPVAAAAGVGGVELPGLLALQEAEGDWLRDRPARRHAQAMLDELAELQRQCLAGAASPALLRRLAGLAQAIPAASDPRLAGVLRAVAVRAAVELARLDPQTTLATR